MIKIGDWAFDGPSRRLISAAGERRLTPKAAAVLAALAETPGSVWSRDALLERAWPNVTVGEEILTHAVAELRRALGDDRRAPAFVETVYKGGYRLTCLVERPTLPMGDPAPARETEAPHELPADLELRVYADYLEACDRFERGGRRNTQQAVELFDAVLKAAPAFALAHAGMARALTYRGTYYAPEEGYLDLALAHCLSARRLQPRCAEAYAAEGLVYAIGGDFRRGLRRFRRALWLKPNSSETHHLLGRACFAGPDVELASVILERAAALRGDDYHSLVLAGKARQMTAEAERAHADFALAAARIGPRLEAWPDDFRAVCGMARSLIHLGRTAEAASYMDRVADHSDPMNYHLACTYARAGETRRALDILENVVDEGWRHPAWLARDPDFDALREDRRFRRIAASIAIH